MSLTAAGERLVDDLLPRQLAADAELLEVFTPGQREQLAALLRSALIAWE